MLPFRRIRSDLQELRWGQVLGELALLILGILIALAVNGWIEDRRDAKSERQYLQRLLRDLDQNLAILQEFVAFEEKQTQDGILAYRALRGAGEYEREAVAAALSHLANRRTLRLMGATYRDLVGTGNLRLIRDPGLRDSIVSLYEQSDRTMAVVDRNNQVLVDEAYGLPLVDSGLVAPRFSTNLPGMDPPLRSLRERLGVPVDERNDRLWALAADAPERAVLANRVLRRTIVSVSTGVQSEALRSQVQSVREAVAAELERKH